LAIATSFLSATFLVVVFLAVVVFLLVSVIAFDYYFFESFNCNDFTSVKY